MPDYSLGLDNGNFNSGMVASTQATQALNNSLAVLTTQSHLASRALAVVMPLGAIGAFGKFAQGAANAQSELLGVSAVAKVSGQNIGELGAQADRMARQFPIGNAVAKQLVGTLQSLGMTGAGSEKNLGQVGDAMIKLAAATGSSTGMIAAQMVQLDRAFGGTGNNVKSLKASGDALVYLMY